MLRNASNHLKSLVLLVAIVCLAISCVGLRKPVLTPDYVPPQGALTVMTYNFENLFDTEDDPNKEDETFLPLAAKGEKIKTRCRVSNSGDFRVQECMEKDWSPGVLKKKLKRLASVISKVKDGQGPDVLIVQEVENRNVLEQLRKEYLSDLGYKPAILIEGPDMRGIDVGVLTKLEAVQSINLHETKFVANADLPEDKIRPTRGVLEVNLKLPDGQIMTVLGVHLPSNGAPFEARRQVLVQINEIKSKLPADRLVVVGGDFNISSTEENSHRLLTHEMMKDWGISHQIGCSDCRGTYFYPKAQEWSFFDVIMVSKNMTDEGSGPWRVIPKSVRVENHSVYQKNRYGSPARFNEFQQEGVSDHWPMVLEIIKR